MILKNFFVFEGLDGSGTTTQANILANSINNSILTAEPTSCEIGKIIRKALKKEIFLNHQTLAYLFAADRFEHINSKDGIIKLCQRGKIVISDRYLFSSLAYQSLNCDYEFVYYLNKDFILPEYVFFINTDVELCMTRIGIRGETSELFEKKELLEKVLDNYYKIIDNYKDKTNIILIDGSKDIDEISKEIKKYLG